MRRLPPSPSRSQALVEFEPLLLRNFEDLTSSVNREVRDAMHYALFSVDDRFCVSAAWLVAPRLGIETARIAQTLCAIETLRCSLLFKARSNNAFEPLLAEAASYGLIPLAFEMVSASSGIKATEQVALTRVLSRAASPEHVLSALHREGLALKHRYRTRDEIVEISREKVTPAFRATGEALALFAASSERAQALPEWFQKLGLFAHWIEEYHSDHKERRPFSLKALLSPSESMELIKGVETELLHQARDLRLQVAAHEIIEPLAESLKAQLQ